MYFFFQFKLYILTHSIAELACTRTLTRPSKPGVAKSIQPAQSIVAALDRATQPTSVTGSGAPLAVHPPSEVVEVPSTHAADRPIPPIPTTAGGQPVHSTPVSPSGSITQADVIGWVHEAISPFQGDYFIPNFTIFILGLYYFNYNPSSSVSGIPSSLILFSK